MRYLHRQIESLWEDWAKRTGETGARIGCMIHHVGTKNEIGWDEDKWFVPASNNKLWTMAVALDRLGPNYRFETRFYVDQNRVVVEGGGDPVFSYRDAVHVAQELNRRGLEKIDTLLLDDSKFERVPWGEGWMWDDLAEGYGAPIHAINMESNRITFKADPTEMVPRLSWSPSLPTIHVEERLTWTDDEESDIKIKRGAKNHHFVITGQLSRHDPEVEGAVWSGPQFFAELFLQACSQVGIKIASEIKIEEDSFSSASQPTFCYFSPPLQAILDKVGADSDNMVAEVLLKAIAMKLHGIGTAEAGREEVKKCLDEWGVESPPVFVDGSGLSMYNLSSPRQYVQLLQAINYRTTLRSVFLDSLAVYGEKGTLQERKIQLKPGVKVLAKTGSLSGVINLSGYLLAGEEIRFIFSLLINGLLDDKNGKLLQDDFIRMLSFI